MGSARINAIRQRLALTTKISKILDSKGNEIPGGYPFYVTSRDTYLSGFGPASGMNNRLVFPAKTIEEVDALKLNMRNRGDQDQIKVHNKIPKLNLKRDYVEAVGRGSSKENEYGGYERWYGQGYNSGFEKSKKFNPAKDPNLFQELAPAFDLTGASGMGKKLRETKRTPPKPTRKETRDIHEAKQRRAGIPDPDSPKGKKLIDDITNIAMKERRKEIIASPRAGSPEGQRYNEKTPLIKEVPFGKDQRSNIGVRKPDGKFILSPKKERSRLKRLDKRHSDATEIV